MQINSFIYKVGVLEKGSLLIDHFYFLSCNDWHKAFGVEDNGMQYIDVIFDLVKNDSKFRICYRLKKHRIHINEN